MSNRKRVSKSEDAQFKVIMVGMSGSGKSCLLTRYTKDVFLNQHTVTVGTFQVDAGVQFASKVIKIDDKFNVKLQIWDTAGQESFKSIIKSYYRNSSVVFLVYSIIKYIPKPYRKESFLSLDSWLIQAKQHAPSNAMFVVIGTHLDEAQNEYVFSQQSRQVTSQEALEWMKEKGCALFFETSSKTNQNVNKAFDEVAKQLFYIRMTHSGNRSTSLIHMQKTVSLEPAPQAPAKKQCCN